jgi:DnaJ-class molecular chaperone
MFDPYEILGISVGTPEEEIKRIFRRMSLKYHPDKNPGDENAEAKFIQITKAYDVLTGT